MIDRKFLEKSIKEAAEVTIRSGEINTLMIKGVIVTTLYKIDPKNEVKFTNREIERLILEGAVEAQRN